MAKAKNKTTQNDLSPKDFIASVDHEQRRADAEVLLPWFEEVTGLKAKMWGTSIIGFGRYHYKYDSGREGESLLCGFSPRKSAMTFYIMPGYESDSMKEKLSRLGKYKTGKSCLYVKKLEDIDMDVLEEIVEEDLVYMRDKYETWDE